MRRETLSELLELVEIIAEEGKTDNAGQAILRLAYEISHGHGVEPVDDEKNTCIIIGAITQVVHKYRTMKAKAEAEHGA